MQYMSAKEAAELWDISQRRVSVLCSENRVPGAEMVGNMWLIPKTAQKPVDARTTRFARNRRTVLRPFVKWAGGKGQLLYDLATSYPDGMGSKITKYAEPFVGGGAVLFDILSRFDLEEVYISDVNEELVNTYRIIRDNINGLICRLAQIQRDYLPLDTEARKRYFYDRRGEFNVYKINDAACNDVEKAALFIFLNKTCFNGLYRVNSRRLFNVPVGSYKNPVICDEENLKNISAALQNVIIRCGGYEQSLSFMDSRTFAYFDPPYRPITDTSKFTAYTENSFDDEAQIRLAQFVHEVDKTGAKFIVSNSDPKNSDMKDDFFDTLYAPYHIHRVEAKRVINSNSALRGKISELLIRNY